MTSLFQFKTKFYADSVEWCPNEPYLSCGNYQLEEGSEQSESKRKGCIYLMQFVDKSIEILQELDCDGILDQKWMSLSFLGTVNSSGKFQIYHFDHNEKILNLKSEFQIEFENQIPIALSLDFNEHNNVLISDSLGNISLVNSETMTSLGYFKGHSFEAWTCSFDKNKPNVFYSGGDDSFLNVFDIRDSSKFQIRNKSHGAGVTSLLTIQNEENFLLTGSYDENLRLFDTRNFKTPVFESNLRGGIWRIKSNPFDNRLLLCACMYENFSVVRWNEMAFETELEFTEHESICYGADWSFIDDPKEYFFATCSFYDSKFSLNKLSR